MTAIKLVEDYAIQSLRNDVRDALVMAGEQCILLQLWHPHDALAKFCPNCADDVYASGEGDCDICFGTSRVGPDGSGVRAARRVWGLFSDNVEAENYAPRGTWPQDSREIQTEAFPMLLEHDVVVRVRRWDPDRRPTELEGFYGIQAVTRTSLRTGDRFGQYPWDVVGQRAVLTKLSDKVAITRFRVLGMRFDAGEAGSLAPYTPVVAPDAQSIHFPAPGAQGYTRAFTHRQNAAVTEWVIHHPLDHLPSVTVIIGNEEVEADIGYPTLPDVSPVTITFASPQSGIAVLL